MKSLLYILALLLVLLPCVVRGQTDTLKITAGQGVDNIMLKKSSQTDIIKLKKATYIKEKGTGIACGIYGSGRFRWATYRNDSIGLNFEFKTSLAPWPFQIFHKIQLDKISITKNAKTSDGFVIGKSTQQNVIDLYGLIPDWKNESYISYEDKGIAFRFDDNGTISEIEIFPPTSILNKNYGQTKKDSAPIMQEQMTVFFAKNGNDIIIDSLNNKDSAYIKLQMPFKFPNNKSEIINEGQGFISYGTRPSDKNNCSFNFYIKTNLDSIFIITKPFEYSYDPCRGHSDWAEVIWELFGGNIQTTYAIKENSIKIVWNEGKSIIILQRTKMK